MKLPKLTEDSFCLMLGNNDVYLKHPGNIEAEIARRCNMWEEMVVKLKEYENYLDFLAQQASDEGFAGPTELDDRLLNVRDLLARAIKEINEK